MKRNIRTNSSPGKRLLMRMQAEKKKTVFALGLIIVMVLMWVKVLAKKGPQDVGAEPIPDPGTTNQQNDGRVKIKYIDLPSVTGRNDVLASDFFNPDHWSSFIDEDSNTNSEVNTSTNDINDGLASRIAQKIKIEAIVCDNDIPKVFVNDNLLSIGDSIIVSDGGEIYEFEVKHISQSTVIVSCGSTYVTLELTQTNFNKSEKNDI
jgi:hypothetical protein